MTVASPRGGPVPIDPRGYPSREEVAGARDALAALNATMRLSDMRADAFEAVFFPGGHGPMFDLAENAAAKASSSTAPPAPRERAARDDDHRR